MKIVFLLGLSKSGKDTIGKYLVENHSFIRVSFADALKEEYAKENNIDVNILHTQGPEKEAHREGMIKMAEDARAIDPVCWMRKALAPYIKDGDLYNFKEDTGNLVITDCRRDAEIDYILQAKELGIPVYLILVDRPGNIDADVLTHAVIGYAKGMQKVFNNDWPIYQGFKLIDATINNNSSLEVLVSKTNACLKEVIFEEVQHI